MNGSIFVETAVGSSAVLAGLIAKHMLNLHERGEYALSRQQQAAGKCGYENPLARQEDRERRW